ncbi:MAG: hypothetical protein WB764_00640 [Xanthobacteraceae bacterium]
MISDAGATPRQPAAAPPHAHRAAHQSESRFGAGYQNIATVLQEVERLGIPRVL